MTNFNFLDRKKNALYEKIRQLYYKGQFAEALEGLNQLLSQVEPKKDYYALLLALKGKILNELNQGEEAASVFTKALNYPNLPEDWAGIAWEGQAELCLKKGENENALQLFDKAIKVLDKKSQTYKEALQGKQRASELVKK